MIYKKLDGTILDTTKQVFAVYSKDPSNKKRRLIQFVNAENEDDARVTSKCVDFEYARKIDAKDL